MTRLVSTITGWMLDFFFGDPARLPHPIVGFGKLIAAGEKRLNKGSHRRRNVGSAMGFAAAGRENRCRSVA